MNEEKFTGKANVYTKYRPSYPDELIEYLFSEVGFSKEHAIADIGSGTGKLTGLLLKRGCSVYGVEPNDDMRSTAETLWADNPQFKSINGSAEATSLPDGSVRHITVAQAFHWFDRKRFQQECQRILAGQGKVVLIWNSRDGTSDLVTENDAVNARCCPAFKGFSGGNRGESPEAFSDFFKDGVCEYKTFRYDFFLDEDSFIGRNLSASYAPKEEDADYLPYVAELRTLYQKYAGPDGLCLPNITRCFAGRV